MSWKAAAKLRLPEATAQVLASLGEHRILSTAQVHAIHFPDRSVRRAQQVLAYLERAGLVAFVEVRHAPRRHYFLTERGADLALDAGEVERRPKVLSPEQAAGPLRAHTLGVNEVGISFLRAARERGEEFGPLSWRHEIAHPLNRGRGSARRMLIADAVLSYVRVEEKHIVFVQRFVEVDRATLSVERLVAELARYGRLWRACDKSSQPLWRSHYPSFPPVLCALAGASRKALIRRRDIAIAVLEGHPELERAYGVAVHFCLLDDLTERGPFAPIFLSVGKSDRLVDWLGVEVDSGGSSRGAMSKKLAVSIPRIALTPPEAAAAIGVGLDFFDANVAPDLRLIRRGRKRLVPVSELERWAAENAEQVLRGP